MFIKLSSPRAGIRASYAAGDVVDWPDEADAKRILAAGKAIRCTPDGEPLKGKPKTAEADDGDDDDELGQAKALRRRRAARDARAAKKAS